MFVNIEYSALITVEIRYVGFSYRPFQSDCIIFQSAVSSKII